MSENVTGSALLPKDSVHAEEAVQRVHARIEGMPASAQPTTAVLDIEGSSVHAVVAPVLIAEESYGTLLLVEHTWPADEHDLAQRVVIAEQGATLAASELLRQRSVLEAQERARDDFIDALVHGRFSDRHELAARARHHRFDPEGRFAVFVATSAELRSTRSAGGVSHALADPSEDDVLTLTTRIGSMLVVLRQLRDEPERPEELSDDREQRRGFAEWIRRTVVERLGVREVRVAYGRAGVGAEGVARSYRQARSAALLAQRVDASPVCGYDDLRVFAAIHEVAVSDPGRSFASEVLDPLRRADGHTGNLEHIVLAYIAESGNLNAAARRLHLHRNTMLYKLERASRALRMDVRDAETQFMVWLAHRIDTLGQVQTALDSELAPSRESTAGAGSA